MSSTPLHIGFLSHYARELSGLCVPWQAAKVPAPRMVRFNRELAESLGLPVELDSLAGAALLCGQSVPPGARPVAQAYAGHQFGHFSPQLGDGRALLLGEIRVPDGRLFDLHLKGSGPTPFARGGDGKAALGPMLREYLMGEAMHALGIPTTRALAVMSTGETVRREGLKPGAVLARVASSHLRVGTFEFVAAHGSQTDLRRLADFAIDRHDPDLAGEPDRYLHFLERVCDRQSRLVAQWMGVGFVHGVMNTDNMSISGETIDYGPCAFMEACDPATVFSAIDEQGRYAWGNQPAILGWNLARLAEALLPLIDPNDSQRAVARASDLIDSVSERYRQAWLAVMRRKLGLTTADADDASLIEDWLSLLHAGGADFTLAFRHLAEAIEADAPHLLRLFHRQGAVSRWLERWRQRLAREPLPVARRKAAMQHANPLYIPRNHLTEAALEAAERQGDLAPLDRLLAAVTAPWQAQPGQADLAAPAPADFGTYVTYCGT